MLMQIIRINKSFSLFSGWGRVAVRPDRRFQGTGRPLEPPPVAVEHAAELSHDRERRQQAWEVVGLAQDTVSRHVGDMLFPLRTQRLCAAHRPGTLGKFLSGQAGQPDIRDEQVDIIGFEND